MRGFAAGGRWHAAMRLNESKRTRPRQEPVARSSRSWADLEREAEEQEVSTSRARICPASICPATTSSRRSSVRDRPEQRQVPGQQPGPRRPVRVRSVGRGPRAGGLDGGRPRRREPHGGGADGCSARRHLSRRPHALARGLRAAGERRGLLNCELNHFVGCRRPIADISWTCRYGRGRGERTPRGPNYERNIQHGELPARFRSPRAWQAAGPHRSRRSTRLRAVCRWRPRS